MSFLEDMRLKDLGLSPNSSSTMSVGSPMGAVSVWDKWLGTDTKAGILPVAAGVGAGLMQGWAGLGQLKLAKQQQRFNEGMARTNLANQALLTNEQLTAKQAMLHRTNPQKYESPETFMQKWKVSGSI